MYINLPIPNPTKYTINDITPTKNYKYLGIIIQANGKFNEEYKIISEKINKFKKFQLLNKAHLSSHTTKTFVNAYITSKFLYHLLIFNKFTTNQQKLLEGKYSNAIKKALRYPKFT